MPENTTRRIAVIAVHGVGDHTPFTTAREIGDLLSDLTYQPSGTPRYAPFTEHVQRVNVRPVKVVDRHGAVMKEVSGAVYKGGFRPRTDGGSSTSSIDHVYMAGQLAEYKGERPEDTYQLLRLEGKRVKPVTAGAAEAPPKQDHAGEMLEQLEREGVSVPHASAPASGPAAPASPPVVEPPGAGEKIVHVYEMYWADLSRLGNAFTQVFGEFYQLLFHLASVGVNNVKAAAIHFHGGPGAESWRRFDRAQWVASAMLAWPIPILNLFMASLVPPILLVSMLRTHLSAAREFAVLDVLLGVIAAIVWGWGLLKRGRFSPLQFVVPTVSIAICMGLAFWLWRGLDRERTEAIAAAVVSMAAFAGAGLIVKAYEKRRPGSLQAARWISIVYAASLAALAGMGEATFPLPDRYYAIRACLNAIEVALGLLVLSWVAFYLFFMWAHVCGTLAVRAVKVPPSSPDAIHYTRARRTRWTARLLLAIPSAVFMVFTLAAWTGILKIGTPMLPGQDNVPPAASKPLAKPLSATGPCKGPECRPVRYTPVVHAIYRRIRYGQQREKVPSHFVSESIQEMINGAGIAFLPVVLGAMLVGLVIAGWALFPAVWAELNPPAMRSMQDLRKYARSLGRWLDDGFWFLHAAGAILYVVMLLGGAALLVLAPWAYFMPQDQQAKVVALIEVLGTIVVGVAVGIFGVAGRIKSLALGFRPAVRVMLDVDNWLREHPRDSNPTARICGRYVSLLRHIVAWRDGDHGYDALVIIAHSQGTVITADLLRFLEVENQAAGGMAKYDPELARLGTDMPIYLFTMGCPLRQLYGLRFPYLYGYARGADRKPRHTYQPPDIPPDATPNPHSLGVKTWWNAFRSGDYIGRHLWRADQDNYGWDPVSTSHTEDWDPPAGKPEHISADAAGKRIEFSIGPGAHTHYWDHTGKLIAEVLDRLIDSA